MVCRYIKARVDRELTQKTKKKKIECALVEENAAVS